MKLYEYPPIAIGDRLKFRDGRQPVVTGLKLPNYVVIRFSPYDISTMEITEALKARALFLRNKPFSKHEWL